MKSKSNSKSDKNSNYAYIVPAVDRAAQILSLLKKNGRGMTIAEVTEASGWHKSSVHKILVTLNHHGLLDRDESTKQYSLGIALVGYGEFVLDHFGLRHEVNSLLKELADISGETANFAVLNGRHAVILQSVESRGDLRVVPPVGTIDTLTRKSIGKAILASLPENQAMNIVEQEGLSTFTQKSITSLKDFQAELARVRKQGYATDFEEFQEGINAVSAPVFNKGGHVFGSISVVGPAFRMPREKMHLYGKECARKAERISSILRLFPNNENETDFISKMKYTLGIG